MSLVLIGMRMGSPCRAALLLSGGQLYLPGIHEFGNTRAAALAWSSSKTAIDRNATSPPPEMCPTRKIGAPSQRSRSVCTMTTPPSWRIAVQMRPTSTLKPAPVVSRAADSLNSSLPRTSDVAVQREAGNSHKYVADFCCPVGNSSVLIESATEGGIPRSSRIGGSLKSTRIVSKH